MGPPRRLLGLLLVAALLAALVAVGILAPSAVGHAPTAPEDDDAHEPSGGGSKLGSKQETGSTKAGSMKAPVPRPPVPPEAGSESKRPLPRGTPRAAALKTHRPGREKLDHSHAGLQPDEEGVIHAWPSPAVPAGVDGGGGGASTNATSDTLRCHGAKPLSRCVKPDTIAYLEKHVLLAIVTGRHDTFRVEVSQCTWLSHMPASNVLVITDVVPSAPHTPHTWVAGGLPDGVRERDGDLFSDYVKKGYVHAVRSAGQGYSAAWIIAQFRFPQALQLMAARFAAKENAGRYRWALLIDDDTLLSLDRLVARLRQLDADEPWYLSRKGWGGAGHIYSAGAMKRVEAGLHECVDRWMVRQFRASDAMLLKCAHHLKLKSPLEPSMSHCPASHLRERILDPNLATLHAKKDMYPPVLLATWRSALYYYAALCHSKEAAALAIDFSACAYGSCKSAHCDKASDRLRMERWNVLSRNNTLAVLPFPNSIFENAG